MNSAIRLFTVFGVLILLYPHIEAWSDDDPNGSLNSQAPTSQPTTKPSSSSGKDDSPSPPPSRSSSRSAQLTWYGQTGFTPDRSRAPKTISVGETAEGNYKGLPVPEKPAAWNLAFYNGGSLLSGAVKWRARHRSEHVVQDRHTGVYVVELEFRNDSDKWVWTNPYYAIQNGAATASDRVWLELGYRELPPKQITTLRFYAAPWLGVANGITQVMLTNVWVAGGSLLKGETNFSHAQFQKAFPKVEDVVQAETRTIKEDPIAKAVREGVDEIDRIFANKTPGECSQDGEKEFKTTDVDYIDKAVKNGIEEIDRIVAQ